MSWKQNTMRGMRSNSVVNQPTGGGSKKSGLATSNLGSAGVGLLHGRTYMGGPRGVQANYKNRDLVFHYKSYIGGIGHSVGGRSLERMIDGIRSPSIRSPSKLPLCPSPNKFTNHCEVPPSTPRTNEACNQYYFRSPFDADGNPYYRCIALADIDNQPPCGGGIIPAYQCQPID